MPILHFLRFRPVMFRHASAFRRNSHGGTAEAFWPNGVTDKPEWHCE